MATALRVYTVPRQGGILVAGKYGDKKRKEILMLFSLFIILIILSDNLNATQGAACGLPKEFGAEDLLIISELEIAQADSTSERALPKIIKEVPPGYPPIALHLGLSGIVDVEIWVNEKGAVDSAYIVNSSNPIFNDTVYENIGKLKFSPAINSNGERIRSKMDRRISFNIHNQEEQKVAILYRNNTKLTRRKPLVESDPVEIRAAYEELIPLCVNLSTLERIVKLHPRGAIAGDALLSMARLSWMNKDENLMIRHLKAAFDSRSNLENPILRPYCSHNHACIILAEIYRKKGDYTKALDYYTQWIPTNGLTVGLEYFNYEREYRISECLVALGQTDKALSSYILPYLCNQTVLGAYPGDTRMPEMAVSIYGKKGEIRKLLDLLRPYTQKNYYEMAKIAYELGEKKQ